MKSLNLYITESLNSILDKDSLEELKELNLTKNIAKIYKKLYKNQKKDRFCNNFPRFKVRDDATLIEMLL